MSEKYHVAVLFTPQTVDIQALAAEMKHVFIFAQHMDPLQVGRGIGSVLPEALKAAGARGVLLNHSEKRLDDELLERTIRRADQVGLASMVCADDLEDAAKKANMAPNIIIVESPELIGVGKRSEDDKTLIQKINQTIWQINPEIRVLHGAGISNGRDVYNIIVAGSQGSGSTSGILKAENPFAMVEEMIRSVRQAWDDTH
jgi:triosephosphate isomerase